MPWFNHSETFILFTSAFEKHTSQLSTSKYQTLVPIPCHMCREQLEQGNFSHEGLENKQMLKKSPAEALVGLPSL